MILKEFTLKLINGALTDEEKLKRIYYFVRDEIKFDFVCDQFMSSEEILKIRKGACMNKAVLFHDMVNISGIPARLHFMLVSKEALQDLLHPVAYRIWPKKFMHTYPEININGKWTSIDPTFDKELHEILLKKQLNFARNAINKDISIEFNINGVRGAQQFTEISGSKATYASNLNPLKESMNQLPKWKLKLQPWAFRISSNWLNSKVRV